MDQDPSVDDPRDDSEKLEWETPELLVEHVETATQGGTIGDVDPVDDAWYS
jgi:hypothetical protein